MAPSKMKDGKLYRATIDEATILHRGDMALMDVMKSAAEAGGDWQAFAGAYWRSEMSAVPEVELMVAEAVVTEVISASDTERVSYLRTRYGFPAV